MLKYIFDSTNSYFITKIGKTNCSMAISWGVDTIVLYDNSFNKTLSRILAHELAHQNYSELSASKISDFRRAAGWMLKDDNDRFIYFEPTRNSYITEHAYDWLQSKKLIDK